MHEASIFGGVFSCVILTFAAPQIAFFALQFGPLETCALILMGLTCLSSVSANNQFKGLAMGVLGLLLFPLGVMVGKSVLDRRSAEKDARPPESQ